MGAEVLGFDGVHVRRDGAVLLDEVTWSVQAGERWVVLGPNGAGKTSVVALAAGRLHATRGTVRILGHRFGEVDMASLRPRIGVVSTALTELFARGDAVRDVVLAAKHGATRTWGRRYTRVDRDRATALLERLDVPHVADRRVATLSAGEWQRVQIARALFLDPDLLLLDEPTANVDLGGREQLVGSLADLAAGGEVGAIVLVTHHLEDVPPGFTDALLLRHGRVLAAGPIGDVLTDERIGETFGTTVRVERRGGRYTAFAPGTSARGTEADRAAREDAP